ncbi:MAG: DUF2189 domain-containing protein [Alphaproteobacteria bacterium]|nr:DUF2189 domain-containing protein [Alphaproteobacteria bacterium]
MAAIRNPIEWGMDQFRRATAHAESMGRAVGGTEANDVDHAPIVQSIEVADLKDVLAKGAADFAACRTDVMFLCIIYPIVGLLLARLAFDYDMLPLLFPVASGFALLGPVAAVGLYEMSRRREQGVKASWSDAFGMIGSPSFGAIVTLGLLLLAIFLLWLGAAQVIYMLTLGPEAPASVSAFAQEVFTTGAGWTMIVVGDGVGFLFALLVLAISVVSFPLLLDHDVGIGTAIRTSVRVVAVNPGPMTVWGLIVAGGLALGSIPLFLGLIVVMPVLGHATWHLYRKTVRWPDGASA